MVRVSLERWDGTGRRLEDRMEHQECVQRSFQTSDFNPTTNPFDECVLITTPTAVLPGPNHPFRPWRDRINCLNVLTWHGCAYSVRKRRRNFLVGRWRSGGGIRSRCFFHVLHADLYHQFADIRALNNGYGNHEYALLTRHQQNRPIAVVLWCCARQKDRIQRVSFR